MKKLSVLFVTAISIVIITCGKAPTGPEENSGNSLILTTTPSSSIGSVIRIPDKVTYKQGDTIKMIASPKSGYTFMGWSGDTTSSKDTLVVILKANKTILANFKSNSGKAVFSFVTSAQNGSIILTPAGGVYDSGTSVIVKIRPDYGFKLTGKSGDFSGTDTLVTIIVIKNLSLTAIFSEDPQAVFYTITINPQPTNGKITITPAGVPSGNGYKYQPSAYVTIKAIPDSSFKFIRWGGDLVNENTATVSTTLDKNFIITAVFEKGPPTPPLTGTWAITGGQYISGAVYGAFAYDSQRDTLVLKSDSTYISYIHKMGSINGQNFSGAGSGAWSAIDESISFGFPLGQTFEYTLSGNNLTLSNGELTINAFKLH
jgi:uncharacterized repeat protein (TIGR02543 family)